MLFIILHVVPTMLLGMNAANSNYACICTIHKNMK